MSHDELKSLPPIIYSSPGSRWVDPALGFDFRAAGLPHYFEVTWTIGSPDIQTEDQAAKAGQNARLLQSLLRVVALYIGSLHAAEAGVVRFHYYRKQEHRGYVKIDANGDFLAVAYDLNTMKRERVLQELARVRSVQRLTDSIKSDAFGFVPIVLIGAEHDRMYYLQSMYGVPEPNAFFNSRSIEFLAQAAQHALDKPLSRLAEAPKTNRLSDDHALMEFLEFDPLMERQLRDCPSELLEQLVRQIVAAAADYER